MTANRASRSTEQHQHQADYEQNHAHGRKNADLENETKDHEDNSSDNHVLEVPRFVLV